MKGWGMSTLVAAALVLPGCSSRPRDFSPVLQAAPADKAAFRSALAECQTRIREGKLASSERAASGGAGAAAGTATGVAGAAVASGTAGWGGLAVMGATVVLAPFAIMAGAWGMAKSKKTKKENTLQQAATSCLAERGYEVLDWQLTKKDGSPAIPAP